VVFAPHQQHRLPARSSDRRTHYRSSRSVPFWPYLWMSRIAPSRRHLRPPRTPGERDRGIFCDRFRSDPAPSSPLVASCGPTSCHNPFYLWTRISTMTGSTRSRSNHGIVIGISGLLALGCCHPVVVNASIMFSRPPPRWHGRVLVYICVDFSALGQGPRHVDNADRVWRSGGEATWPRRWLLVFLFASLNLSLLPRARGAIPTVTHRLASPFSARWWRWALFRISASCLRHRAMVLVLIAFRGFRADRYLSRPTASTARKCLYPDMVSCSWSGLSRRA